MIIFHHNDMDGRCAAAIVNLLAARQAGERIVFKEVDYSSVIDVADIELNETVFIVDFSFKPEVMALVLDKTDEVYWIDHHSTAKGYDYGRTLEGLRDFAEPSTRSGAMLVWEFFKGNEVPAEALSLVSDYDTWTLKLPYSMEFMEGLKMLPHGPCDPIWKELLGPDHYGKRAAIIQQGITAIQYRACYAHEMRQAFGYECEFDGEICYALNAYRFGGTVFGPKLEEYPMCIAYADNGDTTTVSVYSRLAEVHCGEICKKHGGGGHKGAAGFILKAGQERPWVRI